MKGQWQEHRQHGRQDGQEPIFFELTSIAPRHSCAPAHSDAPHRRHRRNPLLAWLRRLPATAGIALSLIALPAPLLAKAQPIILTAPPAFSATGPQMTDTGHALIEWSADEPVTLEIAHNPGFTETRTLYSGTNKAYFVSGLADGDYLLRLRGADGTPSAQLELAVRHQSLQRALWLALVGVIVSLAIAAVILKGARDD